MSDQLRTQMNSLLYDDEWRPDFDDPNWTFNVDIDYYRFDNARSIDYSINNDHIDTMDKYNKIIEQIGKDSSIANKNIDKTKIIKIFGLWDCNTNEFNIAYTASSILQYVKLALHKYLLNKNTFYDFKNGPIGIKIQMLECLKGDINMKKLSKRKQYFANIFNSSIGPIQQHKFFSNNVFSIDDDNIVLKLRRDVIQSTEKRNFINVKFNNICMNMTHFYNNSSDNIMGISNDINHNSSQREANFSFVQQYLKDYVGRYLHVFDKKYVAQYNNGIIYKIFNMINNKIYIGSTFALIDRRWDEHQNGGKSINPQKLHHAMEKFGLDKFAIELVEVFPCSSSFELHLREDFNISKFDSINSGYNAKYNSEEYNLIRSSPDLNTDKESMDIIKRLIFVKVSLKIMKDYLCDNKLTDVMGKFKIINKITKVSSPTFETRDFALGKTLFSCYTTLSKGYKPRAGREEICKALASLPMDNFEIIVTKKFNICLTVL